MKQSQEHQFSLSVTTTIAAILIAMPLALGSLTLASEIIVLGLGALSCSLLLGAVGLLSFGQGLYFGLGAYISAIAMRNCGLGAMPAMALACLCTSLVASVTGWLIVRRRGVYFVMLTVAFAQMGFFLALALKGTTGGENGLGDIPRPAMILGYGSLKDGASLYAFLAVTGFLVFAFVQRLAASPLGSVLRAIRSNDGRAEALGYDIRRFKLATYIIAGAIAGIAGSMNTLLLSFVPLSAIDLEMSERLLIAALIGGIGSPLGALLGAGVLSAMSDFLSPIWPRWLILVAGLVIVIVLYLRDGLLGLRKAIFPSVGKGAGHG